MIYHLRDPPAITLPLPWTNSLTKIKYDAQYPGFGNACCLSVSKCGTYSDLISHITPG
jgi:hypothetical protein